MSEIECLICHHKFLTLGSHLRTHNINVEEYERRFPGVKTISDSLKQYFTDTSLARREVISKKVTESMLGHETSEETRNKIADSLVGQVYNLGHEVSEYTRRRISETHEGFEFTDEARQSIAQSLMGNKNAEGHKMSEEARQRMIESLLRTYREHPEIAKQISATLKDKWKNDPEFVKYITASWNKHPNMSEERLQEILDGHFPGEWKFVGGGDINIGGRLPDHININGKKAVIEMFGRYYHDPYLHPERPTEDELIAHYASYGFKCLVFWEDVVWCDEDLVVERVKTL